MDRDLAEVIASQNKMLIRRGEPPGPGDDGKMMLLLDRHLRKVKHGIHRHSHFEVIFVDYKEVLDDPISHAERIKGFLPKRTRCRKNGECC